MTADDERAQALRDTLVSITSASRPVLRAAWAAEASPGSPAARAAEEAATEMSRYEWDLTFRAMAATLSVSMDNADGLAHLLTRSDLAIPDYTLSRSLMESSARALWLFEPSIPILERLRRGVNDAVHGYYEMGIFIAAAQRAVRQAVGLEEGDAERVDPDMKRSAAEALAWGEARGLHVHTPKTGTPALQNEAGFGRPDSMWVIEYALQRTAEDNMTGYGHAMFRVASAVAHGSWHAQAILERDPEGPPAAVFHPPRVEAALPVAVAGAVALAAALRAACLFMAREPAVDEVLTAATERLGRLP